MYDVRLTKQAGKDARLIEHAGLKQKVAEFINLVRIDPFQNPPPYEALKGDRKGAYSAELTSNTVLCMKSCLTQKIS